MADRFDILLPTDRQTTRWYQAQLFFDHEAIRNAEFVEDGMQCEVILKDKPPTEWERIRIGYRHIYAIRRFVEGQPITEQASYLYQDSSKLKMPPLTEADQAFFTESE